jgi:hypothetical protein
VAELTATSDVAYARHARLLSNGFSILNAADHGVIVPCRSPV